MADDFDKSYWDQHWQQRRGASAAGREPPPNPYLVREVQGLLPGTALEAGCGEGAEAIWLAQNGWEVVAADIAEEPLARAAARGAAQGLGEDQVRWVQADLSSWAPSQAFDLVTTHYAHPAMSQLAFYDRLATWVAPGGSLLVVGHLHAGDGAHDHHRPAEADVTAERITERLDPATWDVITAEERTRTLEAPDGGEVALHDAVVRAVRRLGTAR